MSTPVEVARKTLEAMGFARDRVDAAVSALAGPIHCDERRQDDEPLLTPTEIRGRLRISSTSLWRMKNLPFIKVGGRKRYLWSEVRRHLTGAQSRKQVKEEWKK